MADHGDNSPARPGAGGTASGSPSFDVLLLDFGGVLIDYAAGPRLLEWLNHSITADELWRRWLLSPSVRGFECGAIGPEQFAADLCREFQLPVSPSQFIEEFAVWPRALFPGTRELLSALRPHFTLASFSNTNVLHWNHVRTNLQLVDLFDHHFPSHLIRMLKPDREAFDHIVKTTGCSPERILFLDDNPLNVEGAQRAGLTARRVDGPAAIASVLEEYGIQIAPAVRAAGALR